MPTKDLLPPNDLSPAERAELIESGRRWATKIAIRFRGRGLSWEELKSAALAGLVKAARHFDPDRNLSFTTYSFWWVRRHIQVELRKHLRGGFQCIPVGETNARRLLTGFSADPDKASALDFLTARSDPPWKRAADGDLWQVLMRFLNPRERTVCELRFGQGLILEEIGDRLGITRERVRQLEMKALAKLRKAHMQGRIPAC